MDLKHQGSGRLGESMGGFPRDVVGAVLGNAKVKRTKPEPVKLKDVKAAVGAKALLTEESLCRLCYSR